MGYPFYYFDPTYILVLIGVVLSLAAQAKVRSTFDKYSRVRSISGMTGAEAAQRILHRAGIFDVQIERISGHLTDHYDPRRKVLRLSDSVYDSSSIAAIGVAAHECGHAIQHQNSYIPLMFRNTLVPIVNFGAAIAWPLILIGLLLAGSQTLINLGIILFSTAVLFQLVTLPVEFNASRRALLQLENGIISREEIGGSRKVLQAAALTYVAATLVAVLQLLRLLSISGRRD